MPKPPAGSNHTTDVGFIYTPLDSTESAIALSQIGRVFPLMPGSKRPYPKSRGFRDASTDAREIQKLFKGKPTANVGIATGDGLAVLDVDGDEGRENLERLEQLHGPLPVTHAVKTPGGGLHLYFQTDEALPSSAGKIAPNLDLRCEGGYVVGPGSIHPNGGRYEIV